VLIFSEVHFLLTTVVEFSLVAQKIIKTWPSRGAGSSVIALVAPLVAPSGLYEASIYGAEAAESGMSRFKETG
jgi:hypothetical protein